MEDLTATSAIEDVLIACLIEEDEYDGKKVLCTLRSIIAVTEGHDSFKRLRNTLGTRARYEWVIQQHASENDVALKKRVIDFAALSQRCPSRRCCSGNLSPPARRAVLSGDSCMAGSGGAGERICCASAGQFWQQ